MKNKFMKSTLYSALLVSAIFGNALVGVPARAQQFEAAPTSQLASISLSPNVLRVKSTDVPQEISDALKTMMQGAGSGVKQGRNEVLTWADESFSKAKIPQIKAQVSKSLKAAGWDYEEGKPDPSIGPFTLVTALKTSPTRKALVGFWVPDTDGLLLAWTEMLPTGGSAGTPSATKPSAATSQVSKPTTATPAAADAGPSVVHITSEPTKNYVNVMKNAMPTFPSFPKVTPKAGYVRGYVKDLKGRPLVGAVIGVRSTATGGFYSGSSTKTDAKGFYELQCPWGVASFYCAGYTVDWGEGRAAFGLHPVDGDATEFATNVGSVENWVLLPYGIADRDDISDQPQYGRNYYGGSFSMYVSGWGYDEGFPEGAQVELTLTPRGPLFDGSKGRTFVITREVKSGTSSLCYIVNIPVGDYKLAARIIIDGNSSPLHLKETGPYSNQPYGLEPKEGDGSVNLTFRPGGAKAGMATAGHGNWDSIDVSLSR